MKLAQFSKRGERKIFNNWLELLVDYLIGNVIASTDGVLTKHSRFIRSRVCFRLEHFRPNAYWKRAVAGILPSIYLFDCETKRSAQRHGNLLTAVNPRTVEENILTWCEFFPTKRRHYRGLKFVLLTLENGILYIKVKKCGKLFVRWSLVSIFNGRWRRWRADRIDGRLIDDYFQCVFNQL